MSIRYSGFSPIVIIVSTIATILIVLVTTISTIVIGIVIVIMISTSITNMTVKCVRLGGCRTTQKALYLLRSKAE